MADKVYELRFYTFSQRGKLDFKQLVKDEEFWKVRKPVSKILGVWETQLHGLTEFFHIQVYDDLADLLKVRPEIENNPEVQARAATVANLPFMLFENSLTILSPGSQLNIDFSPSDSAVYELQTMKDKSSTPTLGSQGLLVGRFITLYGPLNTEYRLIRYPDAQSAQATAMERMTHADEIAGMVESRLMVPMSASELK